MRDGAETGLGPGAGARGTLTKAVRGPLLAGGLALLALLGACASGVVSADSSGIAIEHDETSPDPAIAADKHCAQFGKKAQLIAVEPMTFVSQIYYFGCV